jgi:hypothetical protein
MSLRQNTMMWKGICECTNSNDRYFREISKHSQLVEGQRVRISPLEQNGSTIAFCPCIVCLCARLFTRDGKMHDDLKKNTNEGTPESHLIVNHNYLDA